MNTPTPNEANQQVARRQYLIGITCGILMSALGAVYTAGARYGVLNGLTAWDLTAIRYGVSALILLPVFLRMGVIRLGNLGWRRTLILAVCAGPTFSLLLFGGLRLAPLAHGAVVTPGSIALIGLILAAIFLGDRPDRNRWIGIVFIVCGLAALGGDGLLHDAGWGMVLGDAMFVCAGLAWAVYGLLLRRWRANPVQGTAALAVVAALFYLPGYFLLADLSGWQAAGIGHIAAQVVIQGVFAGAVNLILFSKTIETLGPAAAGLFGALVPAFGVITAIPVLNEFPNALQWTGLVVISIGLLFSLVRPRRLRRP